MRLLALLLVACHAATPVARAPIAQASVDPRDDVVAIAEQPGTLYLFARDRATIQRNGTAVQVVVPPSGDWADAATIPALDGEGAWIVARTTTGELWRITASGDVESITDRLGLPARVRSIAASGSTVGIAVDDGVAILQDHAHVARFTGETGDIIAGDRRIAIKNGGHIAVWDLAQQRRTEYVVPGTLAAGFVAGSKLAVATRDAVFVEDRDGLHRLAAPDAIRAATIAGPRLWLATERGLYMLADRAFVAADGPPAAHLFGLQSGDVLAAVPHAGIARLSLDHAIDDPVWAARVRPIFQRVCAKCHLPGGDAGVDLSTLASWRTERGELVHRVVETRTMPPDGTPLSDTDRATLEQWLKQ